LTIKNQGAFYVIKDKNMKKLLIKICIQLTITAHTFAMDIHHPIILLNGSSCAGKSNIAQSLQKKLGPNSMVISYDNFRKNFFLQHYQTLQLLPTNYNYTEVTVFFDDIQTHLSELNEQEKKIKTEEVNNFYKKTNTEFFTHIHQASHAQPIIVDTIIVLQQQKTMIEKQLKNQLITVFVHAPMSSIIERIKKRNALGAAEARYANRVLSIYPNFYKLNNHENFHFDGHISLQEIESAAEQSSSLPHSPQFLMGNNLSKTIIESFKLQNTDPLEKIKIIPRLSHDYIIDTSTATPEQCALTLHNQLLLNSPFTQ
jgi:uridine kinase